MTNVEKEKSEEMMIRKLRNGLEVSLAQLRKDERTLGGITGKYACAKKHGLPFLQLRIKEIPQGKIHGADLLDVLWDEWDKGTPISK